MIRKLLLALTVLCAVIAASTLPSALADGPDPGRFLPQSNRREVTVQTQVETRSDGVHVLISVRESISGESGSKGSPPSDAPQTVDAPRPVLHAPSAPQAPSNVPRERYWSDPSGIYRETTDGHIIHLTPPPIGGASLDAWTNDLRQHPNQTPYLLYVDGEYRDVIWIPQSPQGNNVSIETAPAGPTGPRGGRPTGNGDSTDPLEVALSALGHVPLPNIELRSNPALGLVHLPGWFWVEGYDGRPFGIERRVTVPPEVGDDVPFDVVPMDDPRRQETHYTVEVRIWPTQYEWDFGDGQRLATHSLGKAHPVESDIQHTYEHSSLGLPQGFPVRLTVTFEAEYRVNGGPAQGLPSFQQTYEYGYRVQEIQSVLTQR